MDGTQTFMIHGIIVIFITRFMQDNSKLAIFCWNQLKSSSKTYMRVVGVPQVFENKLHFLDVDEPLDLDPSDVIDVVVDGNDDVGVLD